MTRQEARRVLGTNNKPYYKGMARALQMHTWRNVDQDWRRLEALRALGYKVTVDIPKA